MHQIRIEHLYCGTGKETCFAGLQPLAEAPERDQQGGR